MRENGTFSETPRHIFLFSGPHAARYLHNRLSNSVKDLALQQGCLAAPLSPQGRPEGFYSVTHTEKEQYLLIGDGGTKETALTALLRYKVADRLELKDLTETHTIFHCDGDLSREIPEFFSSFKIPSLEGAGAFNGTRGIIRRHRRADRGFDLIVLKSESVLLREALRSIGFTEISNDEADRARIIYGLPEFPAEINDDTVFLQPFLRHAISFNKGCYVGQEVLERADSFGKVPQLLIHFKAPGEFSLPSDSELCNAQGAALGPLISSAYSPEQNCTFGFARVKAKEVAGNTPAFLLNTPVTINPRSLG